MRRIYNEDDEFFGIEENGLDLQDLVANDDEYMDRLEALADDDFDPPNNGARRRRHANTPLEVLSEDFFDSSDYDDDDDYDDDYDSFSNDFDRGDSYDGFDGVDF